MPILVTGGAGFIGSHLVERLLADDREVVVLDAFHDFYDPAEKEQNLARATAHPGCRLVRGDIRDEAAVRAAFAGTIEAVVHLAARAGVRPSIADPVDYASVNLTGTAVLLEAARRHGVRRFLFGSSSSVYGNNAKVPFSEGDPVDDPISPYAATKRGGELLAYTFHHLHGMEVACLRFFTVYGPRQRPDLAIRKFADLMSRGEEVPVFGDGSSGRDYTYVDDIVEGIVRAIERTRGFHVWNLGGSSPILLNELVERIARGLDVAPRIRRLPMQPGDVLRTWADIGAVRRDLDWQPRVTFDDGMSRFLSWFRAARPAAGVRR
ncbi:MAG TPA: NAD-dependent epimerase/dehydratase family protein [Candidatus Polarisedimenticolaceae bacterium]|nr:NAD-dependent epimerase/dehydratase family protein [Candidatus Polarisedimenticolaceae bacterium]